MLSYFPKPYPDELLYSIIARYGIHMGIIDQKVILSDLFGNKSLAAVPDFQSHLNRLAAKISSIWPVSPEYIISRHTLAPAFLPFIRPSKADAVIQSMKSDYGGNIHTRLGLTASSIKSAQHFHYCPECAKVQINQIGENYWVRSHQLPGVSHCIFHGIRLQQANTKFHPDGKHDFISARNLCLSSLKVAPKIECTQLLDISQNLAQLLYCNINHRFTFYQWSQFYYNLAKKHGLTNRKRIDHQQIKNSVISYWGSNNLQTLQSSIPQNSENSWLKNIFRKHKKAFHPLRHLIVWMSFLQIIRTNEIFTEVSLFPKEKVFHSSLDNTLSKNKALEVAKKRKQWLYLVTKHPEKSTKELRAIKPQGSAVYAWLYRNDRHWLLKHPPRNTITKSTKNRIDWPLRDLEALRQLKQIHSALLKKSNRPRLSHTFLLKQFSNNSTIQKHLADMPKFSEYLLTHQESIESYQIRRLRNIAVQLCRSGDQIKKWKLIRLAGLRKKHLTEKIREVIYQLEEGIEC